MGKTAASAKILATARQAGLEVKIVPGSCGKTPCGMSTPELRLLNGGVVRYTNPILRHIAQMADFGLRGNSFFEESEIDSWLEWVTLEIELAIHGGILDTDKVCRSLEEQLKSHDRVFIVGEKLSIADISA